MKLKPCPFCGSDSVNDTSPPDEDDPTMYWVCPWCVACGPVCQSLEDATEQWNTRAIPEPTNCIWTYKDDPDYPYWASACGLDWCSTEGTPADNSMNYCPTCGGKLVNAERVKAQEEA